jgi:hypothetical protein
MVVRQAKDRLRCPPWRRKMPILWGWEKRMVKICTGCGATVSIYTCDREDDDSVWCDACFPERYVTALERDLAAAHAEIERLTVGPAPWRPIAEAPRQSKAVLVWCPERKNIYTAVWFHSEGWVHFGHMGRRLTEEPTHFRHLPEPPHE